MTDDTKLEVLKSLRSQWMTVEELCYDFQAAPSCIRRWTRAAEVNGMVVSRHREKVEGKHGCQPTEFAVVSAWGGIA